LGTARGGIRLKTTIKVFWREDSRSQARTKVSIVVFDGKKICQTDSGRWPAKQRMRVWFAGVTRIAFLIAVE
jgi:hypothetical protein